MSILVNSEPAPTLEEVWRLFKETDLRFKETERTLKESFLETEQRFKETDQQFKETDQQFKEIAQRFKETDQQFRQTDRKLNKLERLFTSQWGKLVECLVEGALIKVFNERGIPVQYTVSRAHGVLKAIPGKWISSPKTGVKLSSWK